MPHRGQVAPPMAFDVYIVGHAKAGVARTRARARAAAHLLKNALFYAVLSANLAVGFDLGLLPRERPALEVPALVPHHCQRTAQVAWS